MPSSLIHRESADKSGEDGFTGFVVEPGLMSTPKGSFHGSSKKLLRG
jgi:hypothetical protein